MGDKGLTYRQSGVDIEAGAELVDRITPAAKATSRAGVLGAIGGFGALFDPKAAGYADPLLVAATDGVGTKLRLAIDAGDLSTVGIDLVAMCVNDLLCQGAEPLFFLDYFATGALDVGAAEQVIAGVAEGCTQAGCALIGGETAEMPDMYARGDFDLAGFAVGAVERDKVLPAGVAAGDVLLGVASDGVHSNGFSLVRRTLERAGLAPGDPAPFANDTVAGALLTPTRIYVKPVRAALSGISGLAHITGGGLTENVPRILPEGLGAEIDLATWRRSPLFHWLIDTAGLTQDEALQTYNCGLGLVIAVPEAEAARVAETLRTAGETVHHIGRVTPGAGVTFKGTL